MGEAELRLRFARDLGEWLHNVALEERAERNGDSIRFYGARLQHVVSIRKTLRNGCGKMEGLVPNNGHEFIRQTKSLEAFQTTY